MDYQCLIRVSKQQRKLHSIDGKYTFFHWVWTPKCITGPTIWDQLIQVIVFADTDGYGGFVDVSGNKFSAAHQDRIMVNTYSPQIRPRIPVLLFDLQ